MVSRDRPLSFLLDVDNTLLDNDALKEFLTTQLRQALGAEGAARFWGLYEDVRHVLIQRPELRRAVVADGLA